MEIDNTFAQATELLDPTQTILYDLDDESVSGAIRTIGANRRQIIVDGNTNITLSLPQNMDASSNVMFNNITATGGVTSRGILYTQGSSTLSGLVIGANLSSNNILKNISVSGSVVVSNGISVSGDLLVSGSFTPGSSTTTCNGAFICTNTLGVGGSTGVIGCKFNRGDTTSISQYSFFSATGFGYFELSSGNVAWSMEVENRILCHDEIDIQSDERAKTDIKSLDLKKAADVNKALRAVSYKWNDGREDKSSKLGWIAQEVIEAGIGEAVTIGPLGQIHGETIPDYHLLDKEQMVPVLWSSFQYLLEQYSELEQLAKEKEIM
jgi:hypothetical protein